jgi:hypothetical protein
MRDLTKIYYCHKGDFIPFYVGKTINEKEREKWHKREYGEDTQMEIISEVINWKKWEVFYIKEFKKLGFKLKNIHKGGGGSGPMSKETRALISKNKTGIRFPNGYKVLVKSKPGTSNAHKGRISPNQNKGNPIDLFDNKSGKYLSTYPNANRLSEELNITNETIRQCLVGIQQTIKDKRYFVKYSTQ